MITKLRNLDPINVIRLVRVRSVVIDVGAELDVVIQISADEVNSLVDLHRLRELSVGFQVPGFVGRVLQDHIRFGVLEMKVRVIVIRIVTRSYT